MGPARRSHPIATLTAATVAAACLALPGAAAAAAGRSEMPGRGATPEILGGSSAVGSTIGMVARIVDTRGAEQEICSGTVVSADLVLTAGHCAVNLDTGAVDPASGYAVMTGAQSTLSPGQTSRVSQVIPEPSFDPATLDDDAALLVLRTPTAVAPVALASPATDAGQYVPGETVTIAGWGIADDAGYLPAMLRRGTTVIQGAQTCGGAAASLGLPFDAGAQLCAVDGPTFADGTCKGDSGGPVLARVDGAWEQLGVTSFGSPACSPETPGFFTRVDAIQPWIESAIQTDARPVSPAAAPASGRYRGHSAQHQPIRFTVSSTRRSVNGVQLGYVLHCNRDRPLRGTASPGLRWPISPGAGMRFTAVFRASGHTEYTIAGTFGAGGSASGTLQVASRTARDGRCTSGRVRWTASG